MKTQLLILLSFILSLSTFANDEVVVIGEDISIKDKTLEKKLINTLKEKGTLTSTRQVDSYMLAVLCEYPHKDSKSKPYCNFRRVEIRSNNK